MRLIRRASAPLALGLLGLALAGPGCLGEAASKEAHALVSQGARLVDVRTTSEFAAGHLPGAVNLPVQDLRQHLAELEPKDQPIVVYCHSGSRSARAARLLEGAGFTAVHDLGSMGNW